MLAKKRDNYRQMIRRKQLSAYFQKTREAMINQENQEKHLKQQSQASSFVDAKWKNMEYHVKVMDLYGVLPILDQISLALFEQNTLISQSMMPIMHKFGPLLSKIIQNESLLEDSQQEEEKLKEIKLVRQIQENLIYKMFTILLQINYNVCEKQQISTMFVNARELLNAKELLQSTIPGSNKDTYLDLILKLIHSLLALNDVSVMKILKNNGLSMSLIRILSDNQSGLHLSDQTEAQIMIILSQYLGLQSQNQKQSIQELGGVQIIGCQSTENTHFMALCLSHIHNRKSHLLEASLKTLTHIFTMHQYLIDSVKDQSLRQICVLIVDEERKIQFQATQAMNDIIYFNNRASECLLQKNYITDILEHRLRQQNKINDPFSKQIIKNCSYILCNLTLITRKDLRNDLSNHEIWNLAYESLQPSCKLYPMVVVFQYYFEFLGRRRGLKILDPFMQALQGIDLAKEGAQQKSLKNTILRMNQNKQFWQQNEQDIFIQMIEKYRLAYILDDELMQE